MSGMQLKRRVYLYLHLLGDGRSSIDNGIVLTGYEENAECSIEGQSQSAIHPLV